MKVPFSLVIAGLLAGIGFLVCAPIAAVWVLLHEDEIQAELLRRAAGTG